MTNVNFDADLSTLLPAPRVSISKRDVILIAAARPLETDLKAVNGNAVWDRTERLRSLFLSGMIYEKKAADEAVEIIKAGQYTSVLINAARQSSLPETTTAFELLVRFCSGDKEFFEMMRESSYKERQNPKDLELIRSLDPKKDFNLMLALYYSRRSIPAGLTDAGLLTMCSSWNNMRIFLSAAPLLAADKSLVVLNDLPDDILRKTIFYLSDPGKKDFGLFDNGTSGFTWAAASAQRASKNIRLAQLIMNSTTAKLIAYSSPTSLPDETKISFAWSNNKEVTIPLPSRIYWYKSDVETLGRISRGSAADLSRQATVMLDMIKENKTDDEGLTSNAIPQPEAARRIKEWLSNKDWSTRFRALEALRISQCNPEIFLPELSQILKEDNWFINQSCSEVLTRLGDNAIPAFKEAVNNGSSNVKESAISSLTQIGSKDSANALRSVLIEHKNNPEIILFQKQIENAVKIIDLKND